MITFDPYSAGQNAAFEFELARLAARMLDMHKIHSGAPLDHLIEDAPLLDHWMIAQRPVPCLVGLSTGHPTLPGDNRPIVTSDLCLVSQDQTWARTLSRWYRLGRPRDIVRSDA